MGPPKAMKHRNKNPPYIVQDPVTTLNGSEISVSVNDLCHNSNTLTKASFFIA